MSDEESAYAEDLSCTPFSTARQVSAPNPHVVHGSTVSGSVVSTLTVILSLTALVDTDTK